MAEALRVAAILLGSVFLIGAVVGIVLLVVTASTATRHERVQVARLAAAVILTGASGSWLVAVGTGLISCTC